ncbi:hypothetical protein EV421DRAFT_2023118 [Armillaria borealis]|uniref:C2H2-type domain-containing protein n=1 Tax=Armillaria borealis TaxID=47425 RepID=A0AA39J150_9AGAR|nr:hypothetical protein EV421DRAFT_2023118 [Armillaria borealis]
MSPTGLEDTVVPSLVTVDDHTVDNSAPLIQTPQLQPSMIPPQGVFPDRNDILYQYRSQDSRRLWAYSGDIPFCLWHDGGALENYCIEYLQRTTGMDTQIIFDLGIAHKHSDPSKVCFSVSTSQFWEIYWLNCAIPDNDIPPLGPSTGFILEVAPPLLGPHLYQPTSQLDNLGNLDTVYDLEYPDDNENSYHSSSPLAIAEQERKVRPLPHRSTHRRSNTEIRDYTLSIPATAAKRNAPDSVDAPDTNKKRVKLVPTSPVASTSSSLSSLTDLSPSPPLSPKNDSPPPQRTDQPWDDEDLRCIYPDCCEYFPSVDSVIDHHKSVHRKPYFGKYRCAFASCRQTFKNKADFERHAKTLSHQPDKIYLCAGCDMTFTRYDALRRHQKKPSGIKPECKEEGRKEEIRHAKEMAENREKRRTKSQP